MSEKSDLQPIPREFFSEYEDRPFQSCSRCGEALDAFDNYQINKAYRNSECVVEFALCAECRDKMFDEFSEESKENLMRYQQDHMIETRGIEQCCFCGKRPAEVPMKDFIITALCQQSGMLDSVMICFPCQEQMLELLSEQTKDVRRRFYEEMPGVPPDWEVFPVEDETKKQVYPLSAIKAKARVTGSQFIGNRAKASGPLSDSALDVVWKGRGVL